MATRESKRVVALRKKNYDQVSFLIPKGGRRLLRAMGIKERCTAADVIRRAILARAGLESVPEEINLAKLDAAETNREAADALIDCQTAEYVTRELKRQGRPVPPDDVPVVMLSSKWYKDESTAALLAVHKAVQEQSAMKKPRPIEISRRDYNALQRLFSNLVVRDDDI